MPLPAISLLTKKKKKRNEKITHKLRSKTLKIEIIILKTKSYTMKIKATKTVITLTYVYL